MLQVKDPQSLIGRPVVGTDGHKLGKVNNVLLDAATNVPEFVSVRTGMFGTRETVVPLAEASEHEDSVAVPYEADRLKSAPHVDADEPLSQEQEKSLYEHYGLPYGESNSPTGLPEGGRGSTGTGTAADAPGTVGHDTSGPTTDRAMTRSEEQLHVGTEKVETGRARLRKHVVTEEVQQTVPVTREEVRVEREPITEGNVGAAMDGPAISEEEHEVTLHAERPVVAKEAVPVERVRLSKEAQTEQHAVNETVRKEHIDTEGA